MDEPEKNSGDSANRIPENDDDDDDVVEDPSSNATRFDATAKSDEKRRAARARDRRERLDVNGTYAHSPAVPTTIMPGSFHSGGRDGDDDETLISDLTPSVNRHPVPTPPLFTHGPGTDVGLPYHMNLVVASEVVPDPSTLKQPPDSDSPPSNGQSRRSRGLLIGVIIVLLIIVVVAVTVPTTLLLAKNDDSSSSSSSSSSSNNNNNENAGKDGAPTALAPPPTPAPTPSPMTPPTPAPALDPTASPVIEQTPWPSQAPVVAPNLPPLLDGKWVINNRINGEQPGDWSGFSISLSSDGNVLAIGAPFNDGGGIRNSGHVRVYQRDQDNIWGQTGQDFGGEGEGDGSGEKMSLSADGNVLAISGIRNDNENGENSGHVRVYERGNDGGDWAQKGLDIDGEFPLDESGRSVYISADGDVVAIGSPFSDNKGQDSGQVRVYEFAAGVWTQRGGDIRGEAALDRSGVSVAMSADGTIVAIGAPRNTANGDFSGHVRVYEFGLDGIWTQLGSDLDGNIVNGQYGESVALSANGNTLAIGAPCIGCTGDGAGGQVQVLEYDDAADVWIQLGETAIGDMAGDRFGWWVSLSADGNVLAVGAPQPPFGGRTVENNPNAGYVRTFAYIDDGWTQRGDDIVGLRPGDESGQSVSLSGDGSTLGIGAYRSEGSGGRSGQAIVYIFK